MKVLMTTDTVGGVLTHTIELIGGLRDRADVVVATMATPLSESQRTALLAAGAVGVYEGGYALEWMSDPWADVAAAGEWLLELSARERPDVVHLNGYAHAALPWTFPASSSATHACCRGGERSTRSPRQPPGIATATRCMTGCRPPTSSLRRPSTCCQSSRTCTAAGRAVPR